MSYVWANTITTGGTITASAAIEIRTNLSAELTSRSTSYAWAHVTAITSGAFVKANEIKEFRTAADLASASTTCSVDNAAEDSTVNAAADSTADNPRNATYDFGNDVSYDSSEDLTADSGQYSEVNLSNVVADDNPDNSTVDNSDNLTH
jgi:hypothetical protein